MRTSSQVALQVIQQAIFHLALWAEVKLPKECQRPDDNDAIARAKEILGWTENPEIKPLRLLFDSVKLPDGKGQSEAHYSKAEAIANEHPTIPYPQPDPPTDAELNKLKSEIKQAINQLEGNWHNLSLLTLILEKFGSCLSFGESDVALIDMARSTAAVAAALVNNPEASHLSLVAGDLSGIQKFIYTISSDGALKSLRARSFHLELVTEEIVQQILSELDLPRTNVIYAGGGNLYILVSNDKDKVNQAVNTVRDRFNKWLRTSFQGKVFLALDYVTLPTKSVGIKEFAEYWNQIPKKLAKQKLRKFESQLTDFLAPSLTYEPCRVCHRDDLPSLKPLNRHELDSSPACWMCRTMFELGDKLFKVGAVVRSKRSTIKGSVDRLYIPGFYYYLFDKPDEALALKGAETVFLINNWMIEQYKNNTVPLLLGNYGQLLETEEDGKHFIRAGEMADAAKQAGCIPRVGYLRMDVDKLGQIFAKGLGEKQTLPRLAGLSRQMSYFFKVHLNSLAEARETNFLTPRQNKIKVLEKTKCLKEEDERKNLLFIYAGGDDLFVSGAWNEVVEFAFDVYQCFRAYTGNNPDITLSGGVSIADIKFPLYQAAAESGKAEDAAKANDRDSLGLFGEKFKWSEWLGIADINLINSEIREYLQPDIRPKLLGVLPFVKILDKQNIGINYARNFVRNLLITAQIQEQALEKIKDSKSKNAMDTRYYLHLPKVAYTLARLPNNVLKDEDFRISLKSPYNAPYFWAIATWIELLNRSSNS